MLSPRPVIRLLWQRSDQRKASTVQRLQPVFSGVLILLSFTVQYVAGGVWDAVLGPQWWVAAGEHAHGSGHNFTLANAFMLTAALGAGYGIVINAVRALASGRASIDLLVSVDQLVFMLIN